MKERQSLGLFTIRLWVQIIWGRSKNLYGSHFDYLIANGVKKIARFTIVAGGKNFLTRIWKYQVANLIFQVLIGYNKSLSTYYS